MTQLVKKGPWVEEKMLGSGGFGAVHLWRNEETDETIALKRCRLLNEMTEKHRHRWKLEVQIMAKLDHDNVIASRAVPPILDVKPNELPILGMEYCSGGDLRKVLNQPQNCCGLGEFSIRCLVHDIAGAVEYLHSKRIIHRDLKPENVVLQPMEDKTLYKLIDLGYAKELDQGSVCTSFVGTLQYLAPELFASQKYTCTVDYWSFGTVVFECITGYRPFLPTVPPITWHREVCKKSPNDICATYDAQGEVKFYKTITTANGLCRSMQTYMEEWLRTLLRWDPKARGGGLQQNNRPKCFLMLDNILAMKIIYLLHVSTNELLTYPVIEQHTFLDLQKRVAEETKIPIEEQDVLLATGMSPEPDKPAAQCWLEPSDDDWMVFLFRKGGKDVKSGDDAEKKNKSIPAAVQKIIKEPTIHLPFQEQKKSWAEAVHFCEQQYREFRRMILSQRAAMLSLLRFDSVFVKGKNKMVSEEEQLMAKVEYFLESMDHDIELYSEQAKNGGISSERMFTRWQKMKSDVESFKNLKDQVGPLQEQAAVVQTKIIELQRSPFARTKQDDTLEDFAKQARTVYQDFRQSSRENKDWTRNHKPIVSLVIKCVMYRDRKLHELYAHLGKIGSCKWDLERLMPSIERCCMDIQTAAEQLLTYQKQRQSAIWKLLGVAVTQHPVSMETNMCRQESKGSSDGGASIMQSLMVASSSEESLRVVEDSKETSKRFEEIMSSVMEEHEEFTSLMSSIT